MDERTKITSYLTDLHGGDVVHEETREWTGLTDEAMVGWSVVHLEPVLERVRRDWVSAQVVGSC